MSDTYFSLASGDLVQDWSNTGLLTTSTTSTTANPVHILTWANVPSIVGFLGADLTLLTGVDPQTILTTSDIVNLNANQTNPNTFGTGGVAEFQIANPTVALQGSGTADAPYLALYLDATGRQNVTLSFNARDIDGSGDNAVQQIAVQYRIGNSGNWTNLPAGYIADATTGGTATQVTPVTVTLPGDANNQGQVQIRIITTNAAGNDEWVGIDDIHVTSAPLVAVQPGALSINDVSLAEGDSGTAAMTFTVTRSGGSDGAVEATWTVANGTTDAADFAGALNGTVSFAAGQTSATITVTIAGDTAFEPSETYSVVLSNPTGGATILDGSGLGTIVADDIPPPANVFINEFHYDNAGADVNEFVEIAGLAGTNLSGWSLVLYNGNGGGVYGTIALGGTLADSANGFGFVKVAATGLQNGSPDGFALVDNFGRVIQFLSYEGPMTATNGPAAGMTSSDVGVSQTNAGGGLTLQLVGTGSSYADFTWSADVPNTEAAVNAGQTFLSGTDQGQIRIDNARLIEGNAGETLMVFTVHRAGGFATSATVDWQVNLDGSANAADLGAAAVLSGSLTFGAGEFTRTITVPIAGDTLGELNESFSVQLSNVIGNAAIADGAATGTIVNDDPIVLTIPEIQGAGHVSEYVGQPVITSGIVTAVDAGGFYLQDAAGDGNSATSDAIFVFLGTAPSVAVGDAVTINGSVAEFASGAGLSLTEINTTNAGITVTSSGNALPAAVLIGAGGVLPPATVIEDDGLTSYDPASDGIDFWESLEGMRVTVDNPLVVSNTNGFGETDIVASLGAGATGINDRGGITIAGGDFNPEKLQLDDRFGALIGYTPGHTIGDQLGSVTGVIGYSFEHYELLATEAVTVTTDVTLVEEVSLLEGNANYLSVATYNVENLDVSDNKFDILGHDIVYNLNAPDIVALQEVQDADGAGNGSNLSGAITAQGLIDAIYAESGIRYLYVEIAPTAAGTTGGEPGGNIRNGYLYREDRVSLVEGSLSIITDPAFAGSRQPLVATWEFNGHQITTINVHMTSRLGSDPLWGADQPPVDGGDGSRTAQAAAIGAYVFNHLAGDPSANYMILGDWNGFYFEEAQTQLTDTGLLTNLATLLPTQERYSYLFDGNAQLIDNMLVTGGLFDNAVYDAVHLNSQFLVTGRPTDHDPQLALFLLGMTPHDVVLADSSVDENQPAGTVVGTLSATDTFGDTLTWSLDDNAGGRFTVDAATGAISTTQAFDHEATGSFTIVARVTDSAGLFSTQQLTITVADVNEAPTAAADGVAVNEDATSANLWSTLLGNDSDPDAGDTLTISAVDASGTHGSIVFDAATQTLRYVADADAFDALAPGATATDTFTYTVTDSGGLTSTATVTVTVTGINDGVTLNGLNGNDLLNGTSGEDRLFGGNGDDRLFGLDGHDWLQGDRGNDTLTGGSGHDSFVFGKSFGDDVITDFSVADDRIVLFDGGRLRASTIADFNGDGQLDTRLFVSTGGTLTLLGVSSTSELNIDSATSFADAHATDWFLAQQAGMGI